MATVPLSLHIDSDIFNRIEDEAKQNYRKQALKVAIAKADEGEFISQESMREWFASLGSDNVLPRPKPDVFLKKID